MSDVIHLMDRRKSTGEECFVYNDPKTLYIVVWSKKADAPRRAVTFRIRKSKLRELVKAK